MFELDPEKRALLGFEYAFQTPGDTLVLRLSITDELMEDDCSWRALGTTRANPASRKIPNLGWGRRGLGSCRHVDVTQHAVKVMA